MTKNLRLINGALSTEGWEVTSLTFPANSVFTLDSGVTFPFTVPADSFLDLAIDFDEITNTGDKSEDVEINSNVGIGVVTVNISATDLAVVVPPITGAYTLASPANESVIVLEGKCVIGGDLTNVTSVTYYADAINLGTSNVSPFSLDIDINLIPNGTYDIKAVVTDSVEGIKETATNTITSKVDLFKDGSTYYVAPDGTTGGDGSFANPWSINHVYQGNSAVVGGDVVLMKAGDYGWDKAITNYTPEAPVLFKADGAVKHYMNNDATRGANVWFWDIQASDSRTERDSTLVSRPSGAYLQAEGTFIINPIISNTGHPGIGHWDGCSFGEIYGAIIWGIGITNSSPYVRGSAIYTQNTAGQRFIRDTITFRNYTNGVKPYSESIDTNGFQLIGNISFHSRSSPFACLSVNPMSDILMDQNYCYDNLDTSNLGMRVGYEKAGQVNDGLTVTNNVFMCGHTSQKGAMDIRMFDNSVVRNNIIITESTSDASLTPRLVQHYPTATETNVDWDNNQYYGGRSAAIGNDNIFNDHTDYITQDYHTSLAEWQTARPTYDQNSTWDRNQPSTNFYFVRPNLYERGRANIIVYNWESLNSVTVDISKVGLEHGEAYEVRDVQNLFATPFLTGVFDSSNPSAIMDMTLTDISPVVDNYSYQNDPSAGSLYDEMLLCNVHTNIKFGIFLITRVGVIAEAV